MSKIISGGQEATPPPIIDILARPTITPSNRNLVDFSFNRGVTVTAPLPSRSSDTAGLGFGVANLSQRVNELTGDVASPSDRTPTHGTATFIELTYQVQPDFQYVWMSSGGHLRSV
jgi:porin